MIEVIGHSQAFDPATRVVFKSSILQKMRTNCHYLGTAGRGQVNVSLGNDMVVLTIN
jgi:hypothetical protein